MAKITNTQVVLLGMLGLVSYLFWDSDRKNKEIARLKIKKSESEPTETLNIPDAAPQVNATGKAEEKIPEQVVDDEQQANLRKQQEEYLNKAKAFLASKDITEEKLQKAGKNEYNFIIKYAQNQGWNGN